ncbi:MAG TPA: hypothetical protein VN670_02535 [Acidobacteriaceae bacterium]|nr:hypothetical protein [Acidobacteriaceae bacterium]
MAKKRPTHGFPFQKSKEGRVFRDSIGTVSFGLKKLTAATVAVSLGIFTCIPQAIGQQTPPARSSDTHGNSAAAPVPSIPSVPAATPQQSAKARELFRKGADALRDQKSKQAIKMFAAAHRLDPGNGTYLAAYEIARQQQIGGMVQAANNDRKLGDSAAAKQKLMTALSLDPGNPYVEEHLQSFASEDSPAVVQSMPMPQFSSGLVELSPTPLRATFHLEGNAQEVLKKILLAYGITPILDDSVPTKKVRIDLTNATFNDASTAAQLSTGTFMIPLDSEHAVVAKDTRENRAKFERLLLESVYLPGTDTKDITNSVNVIRTVFGVRQVSVKDDSGVISLRAPEATLRAINATLARLYVEKPEVMLDIRVYQVNDSHQEKLGVALPQTLNIFNVSSELNSIINANQAAVAQLIASGLVNPGDLAGIAALLVGLGLANGTVFNQPFALFGGGLTLSGLSFGGTTVNAALNISNTRQLDHIQLRAGDSQKQDLLIGSKYPVVTQSYSAGTQVPTSSTSLSSLLAGTTQTGLSTTNPLSIAPSVQYQDLGLKVEATPRVLQNNEIQMQLKIEMTALAGGSVNGSPIINNQSFTTEVQVHDGGSAMVTGSVSRLESRSLSGIPGLSELPGFAWTASPSTQVTAGKLLIVITPRVITPTHTSVASQMIPLSSGSSGP